MSVCASSGVAFDARQRIPRHRLVDNERWAMLNKSTFQEILNALLAQSSVQPLQPPPPQPLPPTPFPFGQRSSVASTKHTNHQRFVDACDESLRRDERIADFSVETRNCQRINTRNDLSPNLATSREITIRTRTTGGEHVMDRCTHGGANHLHSMASPATAGDPTLSNISDIPIGQTNLAKITDFYSERKRRNPTGVSIRLAYTVTGAVEGENATPNFLCHEGAVRSREDPIHDEFPSRICSTDVATHWQKKDETINGNPFAKNFTAHISSVSPVIRTSLVPEENASHMEKDETGRNHGVDDVESRGLLPGTRESRPNCSKDLAYGNKSLEAVEGALTSKSRGQNPVEDSVALSHSSPVQVPMNIYGDQNGQLIFKAQWLMHSDPNIKIDQNLFLFDTNAKRKPANRTSQVTNLNIKLKKCSLIASPEMNTRSTLVVDRSSVKGSQATVANGQTSVAIGNCHDDSSPSELVNGSQSFNLPLSRWIAMDKNVLFCIIEHVLNGESIGFSGEICFTAKANPLFSFTKNADRTEYPVPRKAGRGEYLQWATVLRSRIPGQSKEKFSDNADIGVMSSGRKPQREDFLDAPTSKPELQFGKKSRRSLNADICEATSLYDNAKPRKRSIGLGSRKKRNGVGESVHSAVCPVGKCPGSPETMERRADIVDCLEGVRIQHDKSSFKWKSEMISRQTDETKSRQNLAVTENSVL